MILLSLSLMDLSPTPLHVPFLLGFAIFFYELPYGFSALIELLQTISKHWFFSILLHESLPSHQLIILICHSLEKLSKVCDT